MQQLMMRTEEGVILDWNPSAEFWFHEMLLPTLDPSDFLFTLTTYLDNPVISDKKRKEIENLVLIDEQLHRVYALGMTGQSQGIIYKNWSIVPEFPENGKNEGGGLDWGYTNDPTVVIRCCLYRGEIYVDEYVYETGLTNPDLAAKLAFNEYDYDWETIADSADPKSIDELSDYGYFIKGAVKGKGSVDHGIQTLKQYKINVTSRSTNTIKELRNYKWKEKNGKPTNVPVDKFNHAMDALRYWCSEFLDRDDDYYDQYSAVII